MNIEAVAIRPMAADELESVGYVRAVGFGGNQKRAVDQIKNNPRYDTSHIIVAEYEGQIIGTTTIFPVKLWLSGVPLNVGAVAAVTVLPDFQHNGVAGKLMKYAVTRMQNEQQTLSVLFPFSHKYYRKFGYGTISDLYAYYISPGNLSISDGEDRVRPFAPDDLPVIRVLYKGRLTWNNGWFTRSPEWWDKIINQWPNIMVYDDGDTVGGYYSYEIKAGHEGRRILQIKEFFAADARAFRGLLSYLALQNEADVIEYLAPADTPLRHCLRQPVSANAQNRGWIFNDLCHITPGPVARIINLPQALTTRFYTRGMSGTRILKVKDPLIPANEVLTAFRLVDGRAETHPVDDHKADIETDIATLTQILCGYMKATDAYRLGYFKSDEDTCSWLDKIIADTPIYIQAGDWF